MIFYKKSLFRLVNATKWPSSCLLDGFSAQSFQRLSVMKINFAFRNHENVFKITGPMSDWKQHRWRDSLVAQNVPGIEREKNSIWKSLTQIDHMKRQISVSLSFICEPNFTSFWGYPFPDESLETLSKAEKAFNVMNFSLAQIHHLRPHVKPSVWVCGIQSPFLMSQTINLAPLTFTNESTLLHRCVDIRTRKKVHCHTNQT